MKKEKRDKKKMFVRGVSLAVILSMIPSTVYATQSTETLEKRCACTDKCMEAVVNADCPVCSSEGADIDTVCVAKREGKTSVVLSDETEPEFSEMLKELQERIYALPTDEEYLAMPEEKKNIVYKEVEKISDACVELSEEEQRKLNFTKFEKLFEVINQDVLLMSISEIEESGSYNVSTGDYLSEEEARCFIGFLFNTNDLTNEQLEKNDMFKLMTGQLSGVEEEYAGIQFLSFMNSQLNDSVGKLDGITDMSSEYLINYLTTKANGDMASEIVNDTLRNISNQFLDYVIEEYTIHGQGLETREFENIKNGKLMGEEIKDIIGIDKKIKNYQKQILALSHATFYVTGTNKSEMYKYFLLYRNNLNVKYTVGEDAFELIMDANKLANEQLTFIMALEPILANWSFLDEHMLLWATEERIQLIERWAEYTYLLEKRIAENAKSDENQMGDANSAVHYALIDKQYLDYELTADGAIITKYKGKYSYVRIPNKIDGYKVIEIADEAFSDNPWLRYVYIPGSIQTIGKNAFLNCTGLNKVILPNGKINIGERAFGVYRSMCINEREYTIDKGLGITLCGPGNSNVQVYANSSGNLFESTDWDGKSVTEVYPVGDIYYINMVSELAWVAQQVKAGNLFKGKKVLISGTLNFNSYSWTTIGNNSQVFKGKIEISDCDIRNLKSVQYGTGYYDETRSGLFGDVETDYIFISGITANGVNVTASGYQTVKAGTLFGQIQLLENGNLIIEDSSFIGNVFASKDTTGGIIGYLKVNKNANVVIRGIAVNWNLGGTISYLQAMTEGGVIGQLFNKGTIEFENCDIKGSFIALGGNGTVSQCHPGRAGGLIGGISNDTNGVVKISQINSEFSAQTSSGAYGSDYIGSIIAMVNSNTGTINISDTRNVIDYRRGTFHGYIGGPSSAKNITIVNSYIVNSGNTQTWRYDDVPYNILWTNSYFLDKNISFYISSSASDIVKEKMNILQSCARTEEELRQKDTFVSWDFDQIWCMEDGGYPILLNQVEDKAHFKINAEALEGGIISSCGITNVVEGANITYKIEPYEGYEIDKLIIDGIENQGKSEYTFSHIAGNHTIVVAFKEKMKSQESPNVVPVHETISGKADGKITGVTSEMEYRRDGETSYHEICGTEITDLSAGTYFVRYKAMTNYDASADTEVTIMAGCKLSVNIPASQTGYMLSVNKIEADWHGEVALTFALKEGYSKTETFAVKVNGNKVELAEDGFYTISNMEIDAVITIEGVADITAPAGSIKIANNEWSEFLNTITFGMFFKEKQDVTITSRDNGSGMQKTYYYVAHKAMTKEEVKALADSEWVEYTEEFKIEADSDYVIYVKMTDNAGNAGYLSSDGMVIDSTMAIVNGVESNGSYTGTTTFTIDEKHFDKVKVDGIEVTANDGNYKLVPKVGTYEIEVTDKAGNITMVENVTVNWLEVEAPSVNSKVYTGKKQMADITEGTIGTASYKVAENEGGIEAGMYNVILKLTDTVNYKWKNEEAGKADTTISFGITKATPVVTAPTANFLTYNGSAQKLVNVGHTTGGILEYSADGENWSVEIPTGKDCGNYTVYYRITGNRNYSSVDADSISVNIAKKDIRVSGIKAENKVYDGNITATLNYKDVEFGGIVGDDKLTVSITATFDSKDVGNDKTVTFGRLILGGKDLKNYKLADDGQQTTATASVSAKDITVTVTPNGGIYEGTITPATATLNGLVDGENPDITLTYTGTANSGIGYSGTTVPTLSGTYKVTATIADTNYNLTGITDADFKVNRANPVLNVSAIPDKNYGEEAFNLVVQNKGNGTISYESSKSHVASVDENGKVTIKGAGMVTLTVTLEESANYTGASATVTIKVKKIDHTLVVTETSYNKTYGDDPFEIARTVGDSEESVVFTSSDESVATVNERGVVTIHKAGKAVISLAMAESNNYLAISKNVEIVVNPKAITVKVNDDSKVYGNKDEEFGYAVLNNGLVGEDTLTGITLFREEGENVGTYVVTAKQEEGANPDYDITFETGTLTINQKSIEKAKLMLGEALTYTGEELSQRIDKVVIDGIEVPEDAYEVVGNTATEAGVNILTIIAKEKSNFTGSVNWTFVIVPTNMEQIVENEDGKVELGNGALEIKVKTEGQVPIITFVTNKVEIIDMLVQSGDITADELSQIANGANVDIVLSVKETSTIVSKEVKTEMTSAVSKLDYIIGQYIDISLFKYITINAVMDNGVKIHNTAEKIEISVQIPENLINKDSKINRTYYTIRYHDGKAEIIEGIFDAKTNMFSFETDRFSPYAIAYKDVKVFDENVTGSIESPKTSDRTSALGYIITLMISLLVFSSVLILTKKRE